MKLYGLTMLAAGVLAVAMTATARGSVHYALIDIGPEAHRLEPGAVGFDPSDTSLPDNWQGGIDLSGYGLTSDTGDAFTISIDDTNQSGADQGQIDWRDRGDGSSDSLVRIGEDFVKNNSGIVRVTLDGLPAGLYEATSYHYDPDYGQAESIAIHVDAGSGFSDTGVVGDSSPGGGGVGAITTAKMVASSATFDFLADGVNPVVIVFDATAALDTEVPVSGLNLTVIPEPATLLIWSLLAGLGVSLGWRRRK